MDENDPLLDDENPYSEANRLLRIAAWAKANGLLDESGEPRKIIGEPALTEDGAVVFVGGGTYGKNKNYEPITAWQQVFADRYSTREAAERAANNKETQ